MKRKIITGLIIGVLCLALLGTTACNSIGGGEQVSQQLVKVTRGDLSIIVTGSGKIETSREARLTFGTGGEVKSILVEEGDDVVQGEVLAKLDTSALDLALDQSQVSLNQAEVAVTQAELAVQTAEYAVKNTRDTQDALELAVVNAQINLDLARDNLSEAIKSYGWDEWDTIESALNKAKAYYESISERLEKTTSSAEIDSLSLVLERAKERLDVAQADYDNFLAGHGNQNINMKKRQVEAAEISLAQALKNVGELGEDIAAQELQVASANQSVIQAQQSVELARLSISDIQRQLDDTVIIAPFDGVIAMLLAEEGDIVPSPSMAPQPIVHIIKPDSMELLVEMDEIDIPLVRLGQEAIIEVDALRDEEFRGTITAVYPLPKEVGGVVLYDVRLSLDVPADSGIKVGMSASADVVIEKHSQVLVVPSRAIIRNEQGETFVKVMVDEQIQEKKVVVGVDDGYQIEIKSGLSEGETVVVEVKIKSTQNMSMF